MAVQLASLQLDEGPPRERHAAHVREVFGKGGSSGWTPGAETYAVQDIGVGLRVTVADRQGLVRWADVVDAVRLVQLPLPPSPGCAPPVDAITVVFAGLHPPCRGGHPDAPRGRLWSLSAAIIGLSIPCRGHA